VSTTNSPKCPLSLLYDYHIQHGRRSCTIYRMAGNNCYTIRKSFKALLLCALELYFGHFSAELFVCGFERFEESVFLHFFDVAVKEQRSDRVLTIFRIFISDNLPGR
jgi:hypothetical protein